MMVNDHGQEHLDDKEVAAEVKHLCAELGVSYQIEDDGLRIGDSHPQAGSRHMFYGDEDCEGYADNMRLVRAYLIGLKEGRAGDRT